MTLKTAQDLRDAQAEIEPRGGNPKDAGAERGQAATETSSTWLTARAPRGMKIRSGIKAGHEAVPR